MSRVGLKIGLVTALLLMIAVATMGAVSAADVTRPIYGDNTNLWLANVTFKDVTATISGYINVTYGDVFKIKVEEVNSSLNISYLDILVYRKVDNSLVGKLEGLEEGEEVSVDTAALDLKPTLYYFVIKAYDTDDKFVDQNNTANWLNLSVDPSTYTKPLIEVEVKNPDGKVAIGDDIRIKVKVWGANFFNWSIEKYGLENSTLNLGTAVCWATTWGNDIVCVEGLTTGSNYAEGTLVISTYGLFNNTTASVGDHTIKIKCRDTSVSAVVTIEEPKVTANADVSEVVPGGDIKITGTTNVADTDGDYDNTTTDSNYVFFFIFNNTDVSKGEVKWENGNFTVQGYPVCDINGNGYSENMSRVGLQFIPTTPENRTIIDNGVFEKSFTIPSTADTGDWEAIVLVMPITNATLLNNESIDEDIIGKDVVYFSVEKPTIEFTMDKTTFARAEDISFKGKTNLPEGSTIYIVMDEDDAQELSNELYTAMNKEQNGADYCGMEVTIGANGVFETDEYTINPDAELTTYKVYAVWFETYTPGDIDNKNNWDKYASVTIRVVKVPLEVTVYPEEHKVPKGGEIRIKGTTTVDYVYVYASESGVFEDVPELPTPSTFSTAGGFEIVVSEGEFDKKIEVYDDAEPGSYTLYIFAPANSNQIDKATDTQVAVSITVTEIGVAKITVDSKEYTWGEPIVMVRGGEVSLVVDTLVGDVLDDNMYLNYTFKGGGLEAEDRVYPSNGTFEFSLKPFINTSRDVFTDDQNDTLIPVGTYTLKLELYVAGDEVDEKTLTVQVVSPDYTVTVPSEVVYGEDLVIKIQSNRAGGYDNIYVVVKKLVGEDWQTVTLDENGSAEVSFATYGYNVGDVLKVYVRDTMGTETCPVGTTCDITDYYDIMPTDSYARTYAADDDVLLGPYEVKIVEAIVTTPTPTTPPPTTPPPTTPPPTTPTPTTPPPTTPTTPPPTTTTPSPGFEAVFAIAGLLAIAYLLRRRQ